MRYLFTLSLGPVQEFIAAARRTADLSAGSQLLQQLAMHLANEVANLGGVLIFPADAKTPGPNKVVAEINTDDPAQLAADLRESVTNRLWTLWQDVRRELAVGIDDHLAEEQVKNFLEFYVAWVPVDGDYRIARQRAELLLAGRKALRDFRQVPCRPGRWKSPLDPSRDCVLELEGSRVPRGAEEEPLFLKRTEYLDAISVLKRMRGRQTAVNVPSTSRMAAEAILPIAQRQNPQAVAELERISRNAPGPVDIGDLMFPSRVEEEMEEGSERLRQYLHSHLEEIDRVRREILNSLSPHLGECPSYYVVLTADGDHMGRLIRQQQTREQHQHLSRKLAEFANGARQTVLQYRGYTVYAGGDDLLALLPVNTALYCAIALAQSFAKQVGSTLSIGMTIVHRMEMLLQALEWAREAERCAKSQRNALAIALHTRGGAPVTIVTSFANDPTMEAWTRWIRSFREGLTHGFPYELLHLSREAEAAKLKIESIRGEVVRIYDRKQGKEARGHTQEIRKRLEEEVHHIGSPTDLRQFAERLIIARFLAGYPNGEVNA